MKAKFLHGTLRNNIGYKLSYKLIFVALTRRKKKLPPPSNLCIGFGRRWKVYLRRGEEIGNRSD